jgi:hypothetical protein
MSWRIRNRQEILPRIFTTLGCKAECLTSDTTKLGGTDRKLLVELIKSRGHDGQGAKYTDEVLERNSKYILEQSRQIEQLCVVVHNQVWLSNS